MKYLKTKYHEAMNCILIVDENNTSIAKMSFPQTKTGDRNWQLNQAEEIGKKLCNAFNLKNEENVAKTNCDFCDEYIEIDNTVVTLCSNCQTENNI